MTEEKDKSIHAYKTGVLMVHGIQGNPKQFSFLTGALPEDVFTECILLPGHGAGVTEFRHSGSDLWLSSVVDAAKDMRQKCSTVIFVGHSMGCLLGLIAEREDPCLFDSMIHICCPFSIRPTIRYLRNNMLSFGKDPSDPYVLATKEANSVSAKTPLAYLFCLHPYMELLRLIKRVRKMDFPSVPAQYFFAGRDEIVNPRSADIAKEHVTDHIRILDKCGHQYFTEEAKKEIIDTLLEKCI